MDRSLLSAARADIEATSDLLERALKLAGLVTTLFAEQGHSLVVVGGAAVEFYTEGAYMSGDIDFCREQDEPIPARLEHSLMGQLGGTGGPRSFFALGLYIDLLGRLENESRAPLREIATPYGTVKLVPVELLIVERVLSAVYPQPNSEAEGCARKLLAACVSGKTDVDWDEVSRLARDPAYDIDEALRVMRTEVTNALES